MSIILTIIAIIVIVWFAVSNIYVTKVMSAKEMAENFIEGQCFVGKFFANIFYAPAWIFKGLRIVVLATIK
ncbi:MAG: hypothetical protein IJ298_08920 [Ruminococcus sp.]|nr:hypothetical protein [Ruminococcus sp.]